MKEISSSLTFPTTELNKRISPPFSVLVLLQSERVSESWGWGCMIQYSIGAVCRLELAVHGFHGPVIYTSNFHWQINLEIFVAQRQSGDICCKVNLALRLRLRRTASIMLLVAEKFINDDDTALHRQSRCRRACHVHVYLIWSWYHTVHFRQIFHYSLPYFRSKPRVHYFIGPGLLRTRATMVGQPSKFMSKAATVLTTWWHRLSRLPTIDFCQLSVMLVRTKKGHWHSRTIP